MRVLFVSESLWQEGVVYDIHFFAEAMVSHGHEVFAIDPGKYIDELKQSTTIGPVKVARAFDGAKVDLTSSKHPRLSKPLRFLKHIQRYKFLYRTLENILISKKIDIIVLYSAARLGVQSVRLAKKYNIPIVFRNIDMLYKLWASPLERFIVKQHEKYVYSRVDKLLALTPKYADYLVRLGAKRSDIELLLFPIDMAKFNPNIDGKSIRKQWHMRSTDKVAVFIGTLYPFGGMLEFVRDLPSLVKKIPNLKVLIVGDGVIKNKLQQTIKQFTLEECVIITGYEPFDLMPKYVAAADICFNVFPVNKQTQDIFSAKIVQYLACGKPVVSSALPGITTVIPGKSAGVLYEDTILGIINRIADLLRDTSYSHNLQQHAIQYIKENHDIHHLSKQFEHSLESLVSNQEAHHVTLEKS